MKSTLLLQQLDARVDQLASSVSPLAERRTRRARFDNQLFHCQSTRLGDYLQEVRETLAQLKQCVAGANPERLSWLAERVVLQIGALQREVATQTLRRQEGMKQSPAEKLQQKLADHHEFERRLLAMLMERERQLGQQETLLQQQKMQQEMVALEARLQRCRAALKEIEREVAQREQGF
ncbi:primosomal replication protein PriC [Winslowiella iniecta]|uniref:Prephenate dehydrogenase n=1 Tax=Winslowiella iniecta TaxID=1560201 RepID=A0A0L7T3H5_9GAMM|nr:primosomal replication protein [Winslowiella iniecta]KOC89952.1 prephenate dehydrogenase [Winslowiella iniecta]KOC94356.1 prephenate dehydrogenase [Winslowiella iniecta]